MLETSQALGNRTSTTEPKPFLKWAGGKRQLLEELLSRVPDSFNRYFEAFLGGGALFFGLRPERAMLSDINKELINAYKAVRDEPLELLDRLQKFTNDEDFYYEVREWDRESGFSERPQLERAARLIYLNKTCFNGLYRVNSKGQFNVPFGKYKKPNIADRNGLLASSVALQGAEICCRSFASLESEVKKGDFVYLDPPYVPLSKTSSFTSYAQAGFDESSQRELAKLYKTLAEREAFVMLSNSASELVRELYSEFSIDVVQAKRAVNSNGKGRGAIEELIVRNY